MRKNLHEINNIREAMYQLQDAFEKFDVCVESDMRHSTDVDIAKELYYIVEDLTVCVVLLGSKGDDDAKV